MGLKTAEITTLLQSPHILTQQVPYVSRWYLKNKMNTIFVARVHSIEGNGIPPRYSGLENPMDRGAWWAAVHGVTKSWTLTDWLHFHFSLSCIGEGNGNPFQCFCLENPRDGGAWWAAIYGVTESWTRLKQLSSSSSSSKYFCLGSTFRLLNPGFIYVH